MLTAPKSSRIILPDNLAGKSKVEKIFEGEMLFRTSQTTLLQMFYKIFLNSKVIIKSIIDPDDNFQMIF